MIHKSALLTAGLIITMLGLLAWIMLSIRSQTETTAFPVYDNSGAPVPGTPGYTGIPIFRITSVAPDQSVTIETNNFPAGQVFIVTMGPMGTQGIGGVYVGEFNSGIGGTVEKTFSIPPSLWGSYQISIRTQTQSSDPFYAFNWFYNNVTGGSETPTSMDTEQVGGGFPAPFPDLFVVAEIPKTLELNGSSDTVRLWLTSRLIADPSPLPTNRDIKLATPDAPLDATPGAPLPFSYGPQYTPCVSARLYSDPTSIHVNQDRECKKSALEATGRDWATWYIPISGLKTGTHPIRAEISMNWLGSGDVDDKAEFTVWSHEFSIEVIEPFLTRGQLSLTGILGILFGPIISGSVLYQISRDRKAAKGQKPQVYPTAPASLNTATQIRLHQQLDQFFDEQELRTLCFEMGIDYDDLPFSGQSNKARELVGLCARSNRLEELDKLIKSKRPHLDHPPDR